MNRVKKLQKLWFLNLICISSLLANEITILVNVFKDSDQKGSYVNHLIIRDSNHVFKKILTFVQLAYIFDEIEDIKKTINYIVWNNKKIGHDQFNKTFEDIGFQQKNRLDIILNNVTIKRTLEQAPHEDIKRQDIEQ